MPKRVVRAAIPPSKKLQSTIVPPPPEDETEYENEEKTPRQQLYASRKTCKMFIRLPSVQPRLCGSVKQWTVSLANFLPDRNGGTCWWCTEPFEGLCHGCPIRYHANDDRMLLEGVFCSWNCALAYGRVYLRGVLGTNTRHYIAVLQRRMRDAEPDRKAMTEAEYEAGVKQRLGKLRDDVSTTHTPMDAAPHWSALKKFGGNLTIEEFRNMHAPDRRVSSYPQHMHIMPLGWASYSESLVEAAVTPLTVGMRDDVRNSMMRTYSNEDAYVDYGFPEIIKFATAPYPDQTHRSQRRRGETITLNSTNAKKQAELFMSNVKRRSQRDLQQWQSTETCTTQKKQVDRVRNIMGIKSKK